jgi:hypothetical protein
MGLPAARAARSLLRGPVHGSHLDLRQLCEQPDEAGLGEHHRQEDRDQHLPPRLPEHGEGGPADG